MCHARGLPVNPYIGGDLLYTLTPHERVRLNEYWWMFCQSRCPLSNNVMFSLADNPISYSPSWTLTDGRLPPYRRRPTIYWIPALGRWLTSNEKLASMGWPTYPCLADTGQQPQVAIDRDLARTALGNGVCLPNLGVALVCALACCQFVHE